MTCVKHWTMVSKLVVKPHEGLQKFKDESPPVQSILRKERLVISLVLITAGVPPAAWIRDRLEEDYGIRFVYPGKTGEGVVMRKGK